MRIQLISKQLLTRSIQGYQLAISPLLGSQCRFYPSCSQYAIDAIEHHGPLRGSVLACKRIARCHPGSEGGLDPVPASNQKTL